MVKKVAQNLQKITHKNRSCQCYHVKVAIIKGSYLFWFHMKELFKQEMPLSYLNG